MISVDCGVRSVAEVEASRALGLDWIITDHHALGPELPPAAAVVHPGLGDYANPHLAGVGVAFKLAQALLDAAPGPRPGDEPFLDGLLKLVALGTVADMVPLRRRERAAGQARPHRPWPAPTARAWRSCSRRPRWRGRCGPSTSASASGPGSTPWAAWAGAEDAVRLLLTRDPGEARTLMARVEALNLERREIQKALAQPPAAARRTPPSTWCWSPTPTRASSASSPASACGPRGRPSAVGTVLDGIAHCSVRAPEGYDLRPALDLVRALPPRPAAATATPPA